VTVLKKASDLLPPSDPRGKQVRQLMQFCQRQLTLDTRLPAILKGSEKPANPAERLEFARLCKFKKLYAASASLYRDAFAADPKLADNVPSSARYDAACYAALAGCGQGKDAANLDDEQRAGWRQQALDWLRADLTWWGKALDKGNAQVKPVVQQQMRHWQKDADLAGVRAREGLAHLPEAERQAWAQLWTEVAALLKRAEAKPSPVPAPKPPEQPKP
jgi:serine/threonine-protein kinase